MASTGDHDVEKAILSAAEQTEPTTRPSPTFNCCGYTVGWILAFLLLILYNIIPITMIYTGWTYYYECPVEPKIPQWFLLTGAICIVQSIAQFIGKLLYTAKGVEAENREFTLPYGRFLDVALFVLLMLGVILVYAAYPFVQYDYSLLSTFCHRLPYHYAFVLTTLFYNIVSWALCRFYVCGAKSVWLVSRKQ